MQVYCGPLVKMNELKFVTQVCIPLRSEAAQTHYMNADVTLGLIDSCLRAVLFYKRLFTKACMGSIGFS